jgi:hypothetical protein
MFGFPELGLAAPKVNLSVAAAKRKQAAASALRADSVVEYNAVEEAVNSFSHRGRLDHDANHRG